MSDNFPSGARLDDDPRLDSKPIPADAMEAAKLWMQNSGRGEPYERWLAALFVAYGERQVAKVLANRPASVVNEDRTWPTYESVNPK